MLPFTFEFLAKMLRVFFVFFEKINEFFLFIVPKIVHFDLEVLFKASHSLRGNPGDDGTRSTLSSGSCFFSSGLVPVVLLGLNNFIS